MDYKLLQDEVNLIPEIDDSEIEEMLGHMAPVIHQEVGGSHGYFHIVDIEDVDRRKTAYTWEPKLGRCVGLTWDGLGHTVIHTYHRYGYYGFFKPSLAEVLAQIRHVMADWTRVKYFMLDSNLFDTRNWREFVVGNHHWCPCHLWTADEEHEARA